MAGGCDLEHLANMAKQNCFSSSSFTLLVHGFINT
jgi:hypothetical protein